MALPPNAFKDLLHGSDLDIYKRLRRAWCLSLNGWLNRDAVLDVMADAHRDFDEWAEANPRMTGPNDRDRLADALLASPYVNLRARWLAQRDTR